MLQEKWKIISSGDQLTMGQCDASLTSLHLLCPVPVNHPISMTPLMEMPVPKYLLQIRTKHPENWTLEIMSQRCEKNT